VDVNRVFSELKNLLKNEKIAGGEDDEETA